MLFRSWLLIDTGWIGCDGNATLVGLAPNCSTQLLDPMLDIGRSLFILVENARLTPAWNETTMQDPQQIPPIFRIDVSAESSSADPSAADPTNSNTSSDNLIAVLIRQLLEKQQKTNELLEDVSHQLVAAQKQRSVELAQWRDANPELARNCRRAAETLGKVQGEFLLQLTEEIIDSEEALLDGEFVLNEFVDRFGPRLAHLNGVLQVVSQLSASSE